MTIENTNILNPFLPFLFTLSNGQIDHNFQFQSPETRRSLRLPHNNKRTEKEKYTNIHSSSKQSYSIFQSKANNIWQRRRRRHRFCRRRKGTLPQRCSGSPFTRRRFTRSTSYPYPLPTTPSLENEPAVAPAMTQFPRTRTFGSITTRVCSDPFSSTY